MNFKKDSKTSDFFQISLVKHMSGIGEEIHIIFSGTLWIWINNLQHTCSNNLWQYGLLSFQAG